ncbi:hypothetical protein RRG08_010039 [Elysia crispata]|uniref:Integrase catalytic domain-containing protein n=1 Tax=Elysia crispata TaxID=231223 RepID=A0AAE1DWK9_9GAST|nr:hypothetical protein RRG08_010039 [Elysia crispata]
MLCLSNTEKSKQKEPLLPVKVPTLPWNTVGLDVFTLKGHDCLLCVDYYAKYPEVSKLNTKAAQGIIAAIKPISARHGIPCKVIADNMPFNSQEFRKFAKEWDFHISTTSPLHPQANGQVQRFVAIIKSAMKKSEDPNIAILQYRNTPITGLKYSPAQLLFNRRLRDNIPTLKMKSKPFIPPKARQDLMARQQKQKLFYDRHSKSSAQDFRKGDKIKKKWIEGKIHDKHHTRSYWIDTDNNQTAYRRNTRFMRHDKSSQSHLTPSQDDSRSHNLTQSPSEKLKPSNHRNKASLTQSMHSSSPPSHDLLQSHNSASRPMADTQTSRDTPTVQNAHYKTKCGRSIKPPSKLTL